MDMCASMCMETGVDMWPWLAGPFIMTLSTCGHGWLAVFDAPSSTLNLSKVIDAYMDMGMGMCIRMCVHMSTYSSIDIHACRHSCIQVYTHVYTHVYTQTLEYDAEMMEMLCLDFTVTVDHFGPCKYGLTVS